MSIRKGSVRPLALGDTHMAHRLHAYLMSNDAFVEFDAQAVLEGCYKPNLIILFGPVSTAFEKRVCEIREELEQVALIYVESVIDEESSERARLCSERLSANTSVIKDFVTMENLEVAIKGVANV